MASCKGCVYEADGECVLEPPVPVVVDEWVDSGHPMLPETRQRVHKFVYPPARHRCGAFKDKGYD